MKFFEKFRTRKTEERPPLPAAESAGSLEGKRLAAVLEDIAIAYDQLRILKESDLSAGDNQKAYQVFSQKIEKFEADSQLLEELRTYLESLPSSAADKWPRPDMLKAITGIQTNSSSSPGE